MSAPVPFMGGLGSEDSSLPTAVEKEKENKLRERYEWRHHSCKDATRALPVKIMQREKAPEGCLSLQPGCVWRIQCHIKPRMRLYV